MLRDDYAYFITSVTSHRLLMFSENNYCEILIENLSYYRKAKDFLLLGYVFMPDHYHMIIHPEGKWSIGEIVRDFNKYTAKCIIEKAEQTDPKLYESLSIVKKTRRTRKHQVWRENPWQEHIYSKKFFLQKLKYIHSNPVKKQLVQNPQDYLFSSYRSLYLDDHRPIKVDTMRF
jgi:putative transposase